MHLVFWALWSQKHYLRKRNPTKISHGKNNNSWLEKIWPYQKEILKKQKLACKRTSLAHFISWAESWIQKRQTANWISWSLMFETIWQPVGPKEEHDIGESRGDISQNFQQQGHKYFRHISSKEDSLKKQISDIAAGGRSNGWTRKWWLDNLRDGWQYPMWVCTKAELEKDGELWVQSPGLRSEMREFDDDDHSCLA